MDSSTFNSSYNIFNIATQFLLNFGFMMFWKNQMNEKIKVYETWSKRMGQSQNVMGQN